MGIKKIKSSKLKIKSDLEFHFFAMAALGKGLSGGDRIFIEFARRWQKVAKVTIYVNEEGREMCRGQKLEEGKSLNYRVWNTKKWQKYGFAITYLVRVFRSIIESFKLQLSTSCILYSASEFWMDSLPAFILKLRYPKITWMAAWYQTAPSPLTHPWSLLYWLAQLPIKPIISKFADYVLVNNQEERKQFPALNSKGKVIVVLGAVDLEKIGKWKRITRFAVENGKLPKVYDAVFQGRFHPQKGVVELIDIWKKVVDKKPDAKLAMIGDGPLMKNVKLKVKSKKLEKNVKLFGYLFDGPEKYKIFSQSKIVVHPAFYDSGGMASAEAMAFGLPAVGFNLKSYESYYPKGMIKVEIGNLNSFARLVLELLDNDKGRETLGQEALDMISNNWSWRERADSLLKMMIE